MLDTENQTLKDILIANEACTEEQLAEVIEEHERTGTPLQELLVDFGIFTKEELLEQIALVSELSGVTKSDYKLKCNMLSNGIYAVEVVSGSIKSVKYYKVPIRSSHVALREKFVDVEIVNVVSNWVIEVLEDFDLDSGRKIVYLYVDGLVASVVKVKPGDRSLVAIY